jgi:hypothetical protein
MENRVLSLQKKVAKEKSIQQEIREKQGLSVKRTYPCKPGSTAQVEPAIFPVLSKLIESVSSISQELRLIRKAIENVSRNRLGMNGLVGGAEEAIRNNSITLDLDAFLKRRGQTAGKRPN